MEMAVTGTLQTVWWVFGFGVVAGFVLVLCYFVFGLAKFLWTHGVPGPKINRTIAWTFVAAGCAAIVWLFSEAVVLHGFLGGDPFLGKIEGDRYYFGTHGKYTEVTENTWRTAFVFMITTRVVLALLILALAAQLILKRRRNTSR
jgi:hypothetical protein